jgi:hypothetical protein
MKYWLLFEVVVFFSFLMGLSFFLLQQYILKLPSIAKEITEIFHYGSVWKSKNAMDFLHYMNFESECFALFVGPLITMAYFHHYLTSITFTWPDVYSIMFSFAIRFLLLCVFIVMMTSHRELFGKHTYGISSVLCLTLYATYLGFFLLTDNDTLFFQVVVKCEMVAFPLLFMYCSANYKRVNFYKSACNAEQMAE